MEAPTNHKIDKDNVNTIQDLHKKLNTAVIRASLSVLMIIVLCITGVIAYYLFVQENRPLLIFCDVVMLIGLLGALLTGRMYLSVQEDLEKQIRLLDKR